MQQLNKLIMEDLKDIFDKDKDGYNIELTLINAKKCLSLFQNMMIYQMNF